MPSSTTSNMLDVIAASIANSHQKTNLEPVNISLEALQQITYMKSVHQGNVQKKTGCFSKDIWASSSVKWYWWLLVAIAVTAISLSVVLLLLITAMWRRKRKNQALVEILQAENVGARRYPQHGNCGASCKPNSSYLPRKPYLESDVYTAASGGMSRRFGYRLMRSMLPSRARPTDTAFKVHRETPGTAQRAGEVQNVGPAGWTKSSPTKFITPTPDRGARKTQIPKGTGSTGVQAYRCPRHQFNTAKQSTRMYQIVSEEPTGRVPPISYVRSTKAFTTPGGHWVRFKSLE